MIRVGTSGFSYRDWEGPFYPAGLPAADRLAFYAGEFDTVEIDYTYYRLPTAAALAALADRVPHGFLFSIKAHRQMTHEREGNEAVWSQFADALKPWQERGCLGCLLAQFPSTFRCGPLEMDYLRLLRDRLPGIPTVVEFRHVSWASGRVFQWLRDLDLGVCCVDQPRLATLLPPFAVSTCEVAYVRLHGRNAARWWQHDESWQRYDYRYTREELAPWAEKIAAMDSQVPVTYVYANNHWLGQAVDTARQLRLLLAMP